MKGLHNIREPAPRWTWRWYSAMQTRRGRRHLIRVPVIAIDYHDYLTEQRNRLPYHLRYTSEAERAEWAERMMRTRHNLVIPANVNPLPIDAHEIAERFCNGQQAARWYRLETTSLTTPNAPRPRGYCETCWREWTTATSPLRAMFSQAQLAYPVNYLHEDLATWETTARREYRPR